MKNEIHHLTISALLLCANFAAAQNFYTNPEKTTAGDKLVVVYNPTGGPLAGVEFDGVAYIYEAGKPNPTAIDLDFVNEGEALTALLPIPANTQAVLYSFTNQELEKSDNNDGKGYKSLVYQADRSSLVKGALGLKSMFYNGAGRNGGIKADPEKALSLMKQELATYPLDDYRFAQNYASLATKQKDEAAIKAYSAQMDKLSTNKKASENDLRVAEAIAAGLDDKAKLEAISKLAEQKYPSSTAALTKVVDSFRATKTLEEKLKIFNDSKARFAKHADFERYKGQWATTIASEYAKLADWANFEKYLGQITDKASVASALNGQAWPMSGERLETEAKDLDKALDFSKRSIEIVKAEGETLASKPLNVSAKAYRRNMGFSRAMFADTYALLLYKKGRYAEALEYQTIACENYKFSDGEMNERYAVFYEKNKSSEEAEALLAKFIAEGKATSKMSEQHKRLFMANNSLESAYDKYVASLEKEAKAKKRAEIEAKMLDEKAPAFTLRNLKGEEVSLESLRGKVLVLDFWATWCGPCKASFPGMQMAVDKYAGRKDVEFLFIDTWENAEDKAKAAGDYIASKSYTFNVLMDLQNEVVVKFGVSGIPTKFVVDGNGKIRFKAVGFNGNDQELVDELSTMIELAGGGVTP